MADLAASPAMCRLVRVDAAEALRAYVLGDRERARVEAVVRQPGMAVNCTIHRTTRLVPLDTLLPLTLAALGAALPAELDAYWSVATRPAIRFDVEAARFAAHLETRLAETGRAWPWPAPTLADLVRLELTIEVLRVAPRPLVEISAQSPAMTARYRLDEAARVLEIDHDPRALLAGARADPPDLADIPRARNLVVVTAGGGDLSIFVAPEDRVDDVRALTRVGLAAPWLVESSLAVRA